MHPLGKAGWLESDEYLFLHDAGGDEGLVVPAHRLHHLGIGRHQSVFTLFGRFDKNHDFHCMSPGRGGFHLKDALMIPLPTMAGKIFAACRPGAYPIVLDTRCTTRRTSI